MNIEKLQNQIKKLSEKEKQIIQKIGELDEKEMEEAVGGLSTTAKNLLLALGALGVAAAIGGTGAYLGHKAGYKKGYEGGKDDTIVPSMLAGMALGKVSSEVVKAFKQVRHAGENEQGSAETPKPKGSTKK